MQPLESPRKMRALRLMLISLTLLVHGRVCTHDFINMDDPQTIYDNPRLNPPSLSNTLYYWNHRGLELYIPCTYTAWALVAAVSGNWRGQEYLLHASGFHLINLCCHVLSVLLVFEIVRLLLHSPVSAAVAAAVFAVHPMQVEAVAWATGLKDVLSSLAALAAIWMYLIAASAIHGKPIRTSHYALATLAFAVAALAKPAGVAAIGIAAVLDYFLHQVSFRGMLFLLLPWLVIALVIAVIAHHVQPAGDVADDQLFLRPLLALDALSFYIWKLLLPIQLSPDYGRRPTAVIDQHYIAWTWMIPLAVGWIAWSLRRKSQFLLISIAVFVAGLLPTLGFVPFIYQRHSTVADRYGYLAMLGPAMLLGWFVDRYPRGLIPSLALLAVFAICSVMQEARWSDSLRLFAYAVEVSPSAPFNHLNYGVALASSGHFKEASDQFHQTLELSPQNAQARDNLALLATLRPVSRGAGR